MEFIQHTLNWCKGEILEGKLIALWGVLLLIISFLYWKFGTTPYARSIVIPILIVGILSVIGGTTLIISNNKRIVTYQEAYAENPVQFIDNEKQRTEEFIKWYPVIAWIMAGCVVAGLLCYLLWGGNWGRTIGVGLLLAGLTVFVIDHFSEERALTYQKEIIKAIKSAP